MQTWPLHTVQQIIAVISVIKWAQTSYHSPVWPQAHTVMKAPIVTQHQAMTPQLLTVWGETLAQNSVQGVTQSHWKTSFFWSEAILLFSKHSFVRSNNLSQLTKASLKCKTCVHRGAKKKTIYKDSTDHLTQKLDRERPCSLFSFLWTINVMKHQTLTPF